MADGKLTIDVNAKGGPSLNKATKSIDKQKKSLDRLDKSQRQQTKNAYGTQSRMKQGMIQTANSTKNFSKLQQTVDGGGGGAGGLVRAYALLAANVFALSAAFGILSRAAQVDNLIASMEQLEVVSGKAILQTARNLQEAAGFGMDYAESMRAASLATSAGFGGEQITELASVARNAAVSLGRNVPDALDRIFRGVIKVEPELLDEIGLFVRVKEASAKYAAQIGKSASDLTEFEKRQAFLNEALEQGKTKFAAFEDIETDAFTLLSTTFSDITQNILSFLNWGILPMVRYLSDNKLLFTTLFAIVAFTLLKLAVPAMGAFTNAIANNAAAASKANTDYQTKMKARIKATQAEHNKYIDIQRDKLKWQAFVDAETTKKGPQAKLAVGGKDQSKKIEANLKKQIGHGKGLIDLDNRRLLITKRITDLEKKQGFEKRMQNQAARDELANLKAELATHNQILAVEKTRSKINITMVQGQVAQLTAAKLAKKEILSTALSTVVGSAEMGGYAIAISTANLELANMAWQAALAGIEITALDKILFMTKARLTAAGVAAQGFWMKLLGPFSVFLLLLPMFQWFNKLLGVGSEEAEALGKANTAAGEAYEKIDKRINHARREMAKMNDETLTAHQRMVINNKAQEGFAEGLLTTVKALKTQNDALIEYRENASGWAQFWGETVPSLFGFGTENAIKRGKTALIEGIKEMEGAMSPAMKKAMARLERASDPRAVGGGLKSQMEIQREMLEAENEVIALAEKEATAFQTARSAIDGARESAKEFTDSLIITTDVDKPLATFRQIKGVLEDSALTEKNRIDYAKEIAEDSAVMALLTREERDNLKATAGNALEYKKVIDGIVKTYVKQQNLLILSKTTLEKMSSVSKMISGLTKESTEAVKMKYELERKTAKINIDVAKIETRNARTQTKMSQNRIEELSASEDILALLSKEEATEENLSLIQAAINAFRKEEILLMEEAFAQSTRDLRANLDILDIERQRLSAQEKLNNLRLTQFKTDQKIAAFMRRGTTTLTPAEELAAITKAEKLRLDTAKSQRNLEIATLQLKTQIILEEWKLLWAQNKEERDREHRADIRSKKEEARAKSLAQQLVLSQTGQTPAMYGTSQTVPLAQRSAAIVEMIKELEETEARLDARLDVLLSLPFASPEQLTNFKAAVATQAEILEQEFENMASSYLLTLLQMLEKTKSKGGSDLVSPLRGGAMQGLERMTGTQDFIKEAQKKQGIEQAKIDAAELEQLDIFNREGTKEEQEGDSARWVKLTENIDKATAAKEAWAQAEGAAETQLFTNAIRDFSSAVASLGEEGMLAATMADFSANLIETFESVDGKLDKTAEKLAVVAGIIQGISSIMAAASAANIANIDKEIKAEEKRDGKSKQSLNRIKSLEAKKEAMARKAFEQNKKMQIASAVMATAAAIAGILGNESLKLGGAAVPLAFMVGALGAAQVAIISRMQYQGGGSESDISTPASINIGERGSNVDVSQRASAGELAFLRGQRGMGTSATAFTPSGGAAGLRKGYANGGEILVGEQGPELIRPMSPVEVVPNDALGGKPVNAHFTINAIDAAGVEDVLLNQQGNIISMIRSAANDHGEEFLEAINTDMYGEPKSAGGIDY